MNLFEITPIFFTNHPPTCIRNSRGEMLVNLEKVFEKWNSSRKPSATAIS